MDYGIPISSEIFWTRGQASPKISISANCQSANKVVRALHWQSQSPAVSKSYQMVPGPMRCLRFLLRLHHPLEELLAWCWRPGFIDWWKSLREQLNFAMRLLACPQNVIRLPGKAADSHGTARANTYLVVNPHIPMPKKMPKTRAWNSCCQHRCAGISPSCGQSWQWSCLAIDAR